MQHNHTEVEPEIRKDNFNLVRIGGVRRVNLLMKISVMLVTGTCETKLPSLANQLHNFHIPKKCVAMINIDFYTVYEVNVLHGSLCA